jgi:membrane protein
MASSRSTPTSSTGTSSTGTSSTGTSSTGTSSTGTGGDAGVPFGRNADRPSDIPAKGWKNVAKRVKDRIKSHHLVLIAAGVAFYAFLASVPALVALLSIAGLVLSPERAREVMTDLLEAAPEEVRELLASQLEAVAGASGGALSFGLVLSLLGALWAASTGMSNLIEAVGITYDEDDDRGFMKRRGLALLMTLAAIVFLTIAIAGIAVLPAVLNAFDLPDGMRWLVNLLVWPVLGMALAVGLAVLYRVGPDRRNAGWRWVTWGAGVAVVVWILASVGFQLYVANFANYNEMYGSLAAIVVMLLWLFISLLAVLIGAALNAELERQTAHDTTDGERRPPGRRGATAADEIAPLPTDT